MNLTLEKDAPLLNVSQSLVMIQIGQRHNMKKYPLRNLQEVSNMEQRKGVLLLNV